MRQSFPLPFAALVLVACGSAPRVDLKGQMQVDGATLEWKPMKDNPNGPRTLCYVRPRTLNMGSTPVGVVWADIRLIDKGGQEYASAKRQRIYAQSKGERGPLTYGEAYEGDANDQGRPLAPLDTRGRPVAERPLEAEVTITGAYQEPHMDSDGQKLDEQNKG